MGKERLGKEWIFSTKEFLVISSQTVLQNPASSTAIFSSQLVEYNTRRYHSAWCTTYQDSTFNASIFLVSCKKEGEEKLRETPLSLHYYFLFFSSRVYCHVLFHTGFCSTAKNWRKLSKNLTFLSSLDAYT